MKNILILLIISLIFESSITTIPLLLIVLINYVVIDKKIDVLIPALIFGILLDILSFKALGFGALFFIVFLFLILLYMRKFEIETPVFVLIASFVGSLGFLFVYQIGDLILIQAIVSSLISLFIFIFLGFGLKQKTIERSSYG